MRLRRRGSAPTLEEILSRENEQLKAEVERLKEKLKDPGADTLIIPNVEHLDRARGDITLQFNFSDVGETHMRVRVQGHVTLQILGDEVVKVRMPQIGDTYLPHADTLTIHLPNYINFQ